MDVSRAYAELGLSSSGPVARDELRRAYLRAVKAHSPERDPEGFQRVRAAYELLCARPWLLAEAVEASRADTPLASHAGSVPALAALEPVENAPAPAGAPATPPAPSAEQDIPTEPPKKLAAADAECSGTQSDAEEEFVVAARDTLLQAKLHELRLAFEAGKAVAIGQLLQELYAQSALDPAELPPSSFAVETALILFETGELTQGERLLTAFARYAKRSGHGARDLEPQVAARWVLLQELAGIVGKVDDRVVRALARSVRDGQFFTALEVVETFRENSPKFDAWLARDAPGIWAAVGPLLWQPERRAPSGRGTFRWAWILLVALAQVGKLAHGCSDDHDDRLSRSSARSRQPSSQAAPPRPTQRDLSERQEGNPDDSNADQRQLSAARKAITLALVSADCARLDEQWPLYLAAVAANPATPALTAELAQLREQVTRVCRPVAERPAEDP